MVRLRALSCLAFLAIAAIASAKIAGVLPEKFDKLKMTPERFEKMKNLHSNSYYSAIKAVIGQLGRILYQKLPQQERRRLAACLDRIEERRDLVTPAQCVVRARKRFLTAHEPVPTLAATSPRLSWRSILLPFDDLNRLRTPFGPPPSPSTPNGHSAHAPKLFGAKSGKRTRFSMFNRRPQLSIEPLPKPAFMQEAEESGDVKSRSMSKRPLSHFERYRFRSRRSLRFPDSKDAYYKPAKFKVVSRGALNSIGSRDASIASAVTKVIYEFAKNDTTDTGSSEERQAAPHIKWTKTYDRLLNVRKAVDARQELPGAKVYEKRMYDIVLDREEPSLTPSERRSPKGIVHKAVQFFTNLAFNKSDEDTPNYRALSPRFMPLMPLNYGRKTPTNYLSPNIMSLYDDQNDRTPAIGSVPQILRTLGLSKKDHSSIMQLMLELTNTKVPMDEALKIYESFGFFDTEVSGPLLDATERMAKAFGTFEKGFTPEQKINYDNRGFMFIKKHQVEQLMRDQGLNETDIDLADFDIYDSMSDAEMEEALWHTVEKVAENATEIIRPSELRRRKRNLISVLKPIILSPFMFTWQIGATVLGPMILSPHIFCPPVLNPSILSPWILTPSAFDPFILSPYIFGPFILGPFAFTSFILTPYAISPNILNPYVFTSLVLSPIALSPDILSPMAVAGTVLSPSVLSPPVLTPTVLTGSVLSPSFLS